MNLHAPIVPGQSAGGISILSDIKGVLAGDEPDQIQQLIACDTFTFGPVRIWADKGGRIDQICVGKGYRGATPQGVRIGMTLREIAEDVGEPFEDEEDVLRIDGISGLALETSPWREEYSVTAGCFDPDAVVTHLFVFAKSNGEQVAAPNRSAAPNSKSEFPVRGSEG